MLSLDGVTMFVSATAATGVVDSDTRLHFTQKGSRVAARYDGGAVAAIHSGHSIAPVERRPDGPLRMVEHFIWSSRPGSGTNVFDEVPRGA
jgi:hypothetical protein